jgi:NAD(P)-dependent dehydrogenase (short-subunit alcohol dehydrogenase family)
MATSHGFWMTNRLANPLLRRLLRTSVGRRLGRGLMVIRYTGTATGRPHELVVQYARDGDTVWVLVGEAERKTWWHNLRRPADVDLWLAGEHVRARAVVVSGGTDLTQTAAGLAAYRRAVPRAPAEPSADVVLVRADILRAG